MAEQPTASNQLWPFMQEMVALVDGDLRILQMSPAFQRTFFPDGQPVEKAWLSSLLLLRGVPLNPDEERWQTGQFRDARGHLHDLQVQFTPVEGEAGLRVARFRRPEEGSRLNHALQRVYQHTATQVGQPFLDALVRQLCRELVVDGAFVAELDEDGAFRQRAAYLPSGIQLQTDWLGAEKTSLLERCLRLDSHQLPALARAGVDVVKTVPLRGGDGVCLGVLGVLDSDRHSLPAWTEDLLVLAAGRCVAEMQRLAVEKRMEYLAFHDSLTDLPNRQSFADDVDALLESREACEGRALLFLDMDRFKLVNDTLGHHVGDRLLQLAARRIVRSLDSGCAVYRISGDEFAILTATGCELEALLERLQLSFERPFQIDEHRLQTGLSVGVAYWRSEYATAHDWLRDADQAMYAAKRDHHRFVAYFDEALWQRARERARIRQQLEQAWERNEFYMEYQPVYTMADAGLHGFEALLRWRHPQEGIIAPDRFVPLCEESGRIVRMDRWVFGQVCRQLVAWRERLGEQALRPVNVNVSAMQVSQPDFAEYYLALLTRFDLDPALIHLEITETALMDDRGAAAEQLQYLRRQGIQVVVDDFGMGYSSLGRLRHLPVDVLKIDRSFVRDMLNSEDSLEVVWAIVTLAHNMNKRIVAEGIEEAQQRDLLHTMRCDYGQGFLLGRPTAARQVEDLLRQQLEHTAGDRPEPLRGRLMG